MDRDQLHGARMMAREAQLPAEGSKELRELALAHGLEAAASIRDRTIPLFNRGRAALTAMGGTFAGAPFQEDMRELDGVDVAIVGAPMDAGTSFRSGTRGGPQALRRISALSSHAYNFELGVDLHESLAMVDCGDVSMPNANIEKCFDQIDKAVAYVHERGIFPVVLGGDHAIGYPDIRALTPFVDGNVGIIHFDRHSDLSEYGMDERTHGTPFFHATNIPNAPATNLVQIGIGGWTSSRFGVKTARERGASIITLTDIDRWGIERCAELALEIAWKDAKAVFLSFDIDSLDPAFAPGTGTPVGGGLLPREALRMLSVVTREGLAGMELVEVAPQYDVGDITSVQGVRIILDVLGTLVNEGKLGRKPDETPVAQEPEVAKAVEEGLPQG
jgi:agmatinase